MELLVLNWWDYGALFSIIFIGIPHGAFDGAIAIALGYSKKIKIQLSFIFIYILIATVVVFVWIYFPVFSLTLFLFLSIFHFGLGDLEWKKNIVYILDGYFHGGLIVFGIIFLNKNDVDIFFSALSGSDLSLLWYSLYAGALVWLVITVYLSFYNRKQVFSKNYLKLVFPILLIILLFPALPAFALYFCLIHSWKHVSRIVPTLFNFTTRSNVFFLMILFSLLSWIAGFAGIYYIFDEYGFSNSVLKITFIGLASLTVPHMILVDGFFRPKFKI